MAGTVHVSSPLVHTSPTGETLHLDEESSVQQTLQDLPVSHKTVAQTFVMGMARMCQHMLEQSQADLQSRYIQFFPPFLSSLTIDSFLRSLYILATLSWSIWLSLGWTFSLA